MAILGRGQPIRAHVARPVVSQGAGFVGSRATMVSQASERSFYPRPAPKAHVAPPILGPAVVAPVVSELYAVSIQAVRRALNRGTVPKPQVADIVLAAPRAPPALLVSQASERSMRPSRGRVWLPAPLIVGSAQAGPAPVARGRFVYVRNRTSRGHVILPQPLIVGAAPSVFVSKGAIVVSQATERATRPSRGRVLLPQPLIVGGTIPPADDSILVVAAVNVSQAVKRAQTRRSGPKPHLAAPVLTVITPPVSRSRFSYQAVARALVKRGAPEPHLSPAIVGPGAGFVGSKATQLRQAIPRALRGREAPKPHLAKPVVAAGQGVIGSATQLRQAVARALTGRTVPKPHVPVLPVSGPPLPPAKVVQVRGRFIRGKVRTAPPVVTQQVFPPLPPAVIVSQASERGTLQRRVAAPHVAEPIVAPGGPPLRPATVVTVRGRWFKGRTHLAPPVVQQVVVVPLPPAVVVSQAGKRSTLQRGAPRPHLAAGIVAPGQGFVGSRAKSVLVRARWFAGRTRTAPPVITALQAPVEPAVIVSQAQKRALLGRGVAKPHVAAPIQPIAPVRPGLVVSQAVRRAVVKRGVPAPHVARPVVGPGAGFIGSRAVRVLQAIRRALIGRFPPAPHIPPARPALPIPDTNPTIIVGRERHNVTGTEDFGIVGRERHNVSGTEEFGIVGRERQPWPT